MSAVIYETVNLYNRERGVIPYRYIGSDQHNDSTYLGSSKDLCRDIKQLGREYFSKRVLCEFKEDIPNTLLRKLESEIQKFLDVAADVTYYNKTNSSHKGYRETEEQKKARMSKTLEKRKLWWESLTKEQQEEHTIRVKGNIIAHNKSIEGKTYEEIYGEEKGRLKRQKHSGGNNGNAKRVLHVNSNETFESTSEAMQHFGIKYYGSFHSRIKKGEFIFV